MLKMQLNLHEQATTCLLINHTERSCHMQQIVHEQQLNLRKPQKIYYSRG